MKEHADKQRDNQGHSSADQHFNQTPLLRTFTPPPLQFSAHTSTQLKPEEGPEEDTGTHQSKDNLFAGSGAFPNEENTKQFSKASAETPGSKSEAGLNVPPNQDKSLNTPVGVVQRIVNIPTPPPKLPKGYPFHPAVDYPNPVRDTMPTPREVHHATDEERAELRTAIHDKINEYNEAVTVNEQTGVFTPLRKVRIPTDEEIFSTSIYEVDGNDWTRIGGAVPKNKSERERRGVVIGGEQEHPFLGEMVNPQSTATPKLQEHEIIAQFVKQWTPIMRELEASYKSLADAVKSGSRKGAELAAAGLLKLGLGITRLSTDFLSGGTASLVTGGMSVAMDAGLAMRDHQSGKNKLARRNHARQTTTRVNNPEAAPTTPSNKMTERGRTALTSAKVLKSAAMMPGEMLVEKHAGQQVAKVLPIVGGISEIGEALLLFGQAVGKIRNTEFWEQAIVTKWTRIGVSQLLQGFINQTNEARKTMSPSNKDVLWQVIAQAETTKSVLLQLNQEIDNAKPVVSPGSMLNPVLWAAKKWQRRSMLAKGRKVAKEAGSSESLWSGARETEAHARSHADKVEQERIKNWVNAHGPEVSNAFGNTPPQAEVPSEESPPIPLAEEANVEPTPDALPVGQDENPALEAENQPPVVDRSAGARARRREERARRRRERNKPSVEQPAEVPKTPQEAAANLDQSSIMDSSGEEENLVLEA